MTRNATLALLMVLSGAAGAIGAVIAVHQVSSWSLISPPICTALIDGKDIKFENPLAPIREWSTGGSGVSEARCQALLQAMREGYDSIRRALSTPGQDLREDEDRELLRAATLAMKSPAVNCVGITPAKGEPVIGVSGRFLQCVPHDTVDRAKGEAYGK